MAPTQILLISSQKYSWLFYSQIDYESCKHLKLHGNKIKDLKSLKIL